MLSNTVSRDIVLRVVALKDVVLVSIVSRVTVVRDVVLWIVMWVCGDEDYCVERYSVGGCGVGGCRGGRLYVKNMI